MYRSFSIRSALAPQIEMVGAALPDVGSSGQCLGWHWGRRVRRVANINVKISLRLDLGMPTLPEKARERGWGNRRSELPSAAKAAMILGPCGTNRKLLPFHVKK